MLHQSTSGFTPRPRPPRSRSHQQTLNSAPPVTLHGANKDISEMVRQSILESRDVGIVALDTPQYTPPLGQLEQPALSSSTSQKIGKEVMLPSGDSNTSLPRSSSQRSIRSPEELEELLYQAHRIIQDRERDLTLAASIGKSLLDNNTALRAKQDALLQRVRRTSISTQANQDLFDAYAEARAEFIEGRPPKSPRTSMVTASPSMHGRSWSNASQPASQHGSPVRRKILSPTNSPRTTRSFVFRQSGHFQHSRDGGSLDSAASSMYDAPSLRQSSRSSAERNELRFSQPAKTLNLQQQAALYMQNAELEDKLTELENELSRANVAGKKKLRKLNKELLGLRRELDDAHLHNIELEQHLHAGNGHTTVHERQKWSVDQHSKDSRDSAVFDDSIRDSIHDTAAVPPDNDTDSPEPTHHEGGNASMISDLTECSSSNSVSSQTHSGPELAALLAKVEELQQANAEMTAARATAEARLSEAAQQFDEMKRKYQFLEDRVIEAEMRSHMVIGWESRRPAIEWHPEGQTDGLGESTSTVTSLPRRALGNRALVERHRRFSSLYGAPHIVETGRLSAAQLAAHDGSCHQTPLNTVHTPEKRSQSVSRSYGEPQLTSPTASSKASARKSGSTFHDDWSPKSHPGNVLDALRRVEEDAAAMRELGKMQAKVRDTSEASLNNVESVEWNCVQPQRSRSASATPSQPTDAHPTSPTSPGSLLRKLQCVASELQCVPTQRDYGAGDYSAASSLATIGQRSHDAARAAQQIVAAMMALQLHKSAEAPQDALLPPGPPSAEAYELLEQALTDLPVEWADDDIRLIRQSLLRDIEAGESGDRRQTQGGLAWAYVDTEEDNDKNDPWKDEGKGRPALENEKIANERELAEARAARRQRRLAELASELLQEEGPEYASSFVRDVPLQLLRFGSMDASEDNSAELAAQQDDALAMEYDNIDAECAQGASGTDYWPVTRRARYMPSVVAVRARTASADYVNSWLLWSRFLTALTVAVAVSVWRGPEVGLGLPARRHAGRQFPRQRRP